MFKRVLSLLLVLVLCLGILAGCGGNETPGGGDDTKPSLDISTDTSGPLFDTLTTINMSMVANTNYELEGTFLDQLLATQENIDLSITPLYNFTQVYQQMLVDQDLPDLTWINANHFGNEYGPKGAYVNVMEYLDQMPNLKAALEKYPEALKSWQTEDGALYHVPCISTGDTDPYAFIYRKDVFEKHDLTFATTREEFVTMLRTLKQLYPNSYPFVLRQMSGNMQGFMYLTMSFGAELPLTGATQALFTKHFKTGEWHYGAISDGMEDYVGFLNDLYEEGLLHKSCITLTDAQWAETFAKGDNSEGVSFVGWDKMDRIPIVLQPAGEALNPEFRLVSAAPIKFNDLGEAATYRSDAGGYSFLISAKAKNLTEILTYIDWLYSEEGVTTTNWGMENVTFEYDAEGNKKWTSALMNEVDPQYSRGLALGGMYGITDFDAYLAWQDEIQKESLALANKYATLTPRVALTYTTEQQTIYDTYMLSLHDYARGELQKFVTGERDVADWDTFVSEVTADNMRYADLKRIHEEAYERLYGNS